MVMMLRTLFTTLAALSLALWAGGIATADDAAKPGTHQGMVVKAADGQLTMSDKDGKEQHTHVVAIDAKITRDGKEAKLEDLKPGDQVRVTAEKKGDKTMVTKIEAKHGERR
jgi:hypothetical protein